MGFDGEWDEATRQCVGRKVACNGLRDNNGLLAMLHMFVNTARGRWQALNIE